VAEKKFICTVLKLFEEKQSPMGGLTRLQIVQWNKYSPVLEKREYFMKDDEERTGKAKGFNSEDFDIIANNIGEIQKLLEKESKG